MRLDAVLIDQPTEHIGRIISAITYEFGWTEGGAERNQSRDVDQRAAVAAEATASGGKGGVGSIVRHHFDATASDPGSKDSGVHAKRVTGPRFCADPARVPGVTVSIAAVFRLLAVRGSSHRPDFDDVGHEVPQQILDAVLQRSGR